MIKYIQKTTKKEGEAPILIRVHRRDPRIDMYIKTGRVWNVKEYAKACRSERTFNNFLKEHEELNADLNAAEKILMDLLNQGIYNKKQIEETIAVSLPSAKEVGETAREIAKNMKNNPNVTLAKYIDDMLVGK